MIGKTCWTENPCISALMLVMASSANTIAYPRSNPARAVDSTPKFVAIPAMTRVFTPRRRSSWSSSVP